MESLFKATISINNHPVVYQVVFDQEAYVFSAEDGGAEWQKFALKREHDSWMGEEGLPSEIESQAVISLERYLLKQH